MHRRPPASRLADLLMEAAWAETFQAHLGTAAFRGALRQRMQEVLDNFGIPRDQQGPLGEISAADRP